MMMIKGEEENQRKGGRFKTALLVFIRDVIRFVTGILVDVWSIITDTYDSGHTKTIHFFPRPFYFSGPFKARGHAPGWSGGQACGLTRHQGRSLFLLGQKAPLWHVEKPRRSISRQLDTLVISVWISYEFSTLMMIHALLNEFDLIPRQP